MKTSTPAESPPNHLQLPAWLLSLFCHLVLLLVVAWVAPATVPHGLPEAPRLAGIVLAQRTEQERFQYTDEDSTSEQAAEEMDRPRTAHASRIRPRPTPRSCLL